MKENLWFVSGFIKQRHIYSRFSAGWAFIAGFLWIVNYFFLEKICSFFWFWESQYCTDFHSYVVIAVFSVLLVTVLSVVNSLRRWEEVFPQSIRYLIGNVVLLAVVFFFVSYVLLSGGTVTGDFILPLATLLYGVLIIMSRICLPKIIEYFWYLVFAAGILMFFFFEQRAEIALGILGFGHMTIGMSLRLMNEK